MPSAQQRHPHGAVVALGVQHVLVTRIQGEAPVVLLQLARLVLIKPRIFVALLCSLGSLEGVQSC